MARLHLSELIEPNHSYHDYCLCYVSSITNEPDKEIYVPISGVKLAETIPLKRISFPLTTQYPEPITIKGFTDNRYDSNKILILEGDTEALIIKNFIFGKDKNTIKLIFGKYAVYKIKDGVGRLNGRYVYLIDGQFFNTYKNTKLKNFLFQKLIPQYSDTPYSNFRMWGFGSNVFTVPKMNTNMQCIEKSIKNSIPKFSFGNITYKLDYNGALNSIMLLEELSYMCDKKDINQVKSRIPNYAFKMSETEINSLSLPKITVSATNSGNED